MVRARQRALQRATSDVLLTVPPRVYVERLTGVRVPRDAKIACPFHDDRKPSLHVYDEPERGWYCYGCRRGGSVYDFAALLWSTSTCGRDFIVLHRKLCGRLAAEFKRPVKGGRLCGPSRPGG